MPRHAIRFLVVVPDGVAKVSVVFERGPIHLQNKVEEKLLFDQRTPRGSGVAFEEVAAKPARPWLMTWETASGKVIKRIPLPTDLG